MRRPLYPVSDRPNDNRYLESMRLVRVVRVVRGTILPSRGIERTAASVLPELLHPGANPIPCHIGARKSGLLDRWGNDIPIKGVAVVEEVCELRFIKIGAARFARLYARILFVGVRWRADAVLCRALPWNSYWVRATCLCATPTLGARASFR